MNFKPMNHQTSLVCVTNRRRLIEFCFIFCATFLNFHFHFLQKSKELPSVSNGERTQQVVMMSRERSIDNKLQPQHQVHQQQQQQQTKSTTSRWREKETEMQTRLTEREKEIGRLKEKLRDLTKKLQQEQHYNSKVGNNNNNNFLDSFVQFFFFGFPGKLNQTNQIQYTVNRDCVST